MSADHTRREINRLDNEIAALEKKRADIEQKEANKISNINNVQRSITKNTSASMLNSKNKQIQGYQNEIARFSKEKADVTIRLANKRKERAGKVVRLQREEAGERQQEKMKQNRAQAAIQRDYERRIDDLTAQLKSQTVLSIQNHTIPENSLEEYDVFISHAWEDKEDFVDEFVQELSDLGVNAWYDKKRIVWGDSMRAKIDAGLSRSKFGIVVISPSFIAEGKYWTKTELDGLFQIESVNGKTILPIWHNITKKEVTAYSPLIASRLAMTTATMTPKEIAEELLKLLHPTEMEETEQ